MFGLLPEPLIAKLQTLVNETSRKVRKRIPVKNSQLQFTKSNLPDLILIDGGKGQLGMAVGELKKLGLEKIPVIGSRPSS